MAKHPNAGGKFLVAILLPEGADQRKAFKNLPEGTLYAGDWIDDSQLLDPGMATVTGKGMGWAIQRALEAQDK